MKKQREIGKEGTDKCDNEEGKLLDVDKKEIKKINKGGKKRIGHRENLMESRDKRDSVDEG